MSVEYKKNVYVANLDNESKETQEICFNLCSFIHNKLKAPWKFGKKNYNFMLLECLCNTLFISTTSIQKNIYKAMNEGKSMVLKKLLLSNY